MLLMSPNSLAPLHFILALPDIWLFFSLLTCSSHARRASSNFFALIISRTVWLRRLFSENALEF